MPPEVASGGGGGGGGGGGTKIKMSATVFVWHFRVKDSQQLS